MGKVKVNTLSNSKMNKICKEAPNCDKCPLTRYSKDGRRILCYRRCRALYYMNKHYYEELFKQDLTKTDREYHEAIWEQEQLDQQKLESEEIELNADI